MPPLVPPLARRGSLDSSLSVSLGGVVQSVGMRAMAEVERITPEERTTDVGLYHYGLSYFNAARGLAELKLKDSNTDSPVRFLYYRSIELFLKAFLRLKGLSVQTVRRISHTVDDLAARCAYHGFEFDDEDREVIDLMASDDTMIQSRYIETGSFTWPSIEELDRTAKSLLEGTRAAMLAAGRPIR
jgi:HEPN domain-containing protein